MDETSGSNDMVSNTTVEKRDSKEVSMKSTGHYKVCVFVCLTEKVDGTIVIRNGKIVWKHGPYLADSDINLKFRGWPERLCINLSKRKLILMLLEL